FFSAKSSAGYLQVSGASINSASTSTLYALSGITIEKSANLNSKGNLTVTAADGYANLTIADNVSLNVGALKGTPAANGILSPTEISSKAGMTLTAGSAVGIGSNNIWTANGGDIKLTAKGTAGAAIGFIGMGTNNKFVANGGNIIILAKGVVYGNDGNFFHARAAGTSVSNGKGGGIEVGSGLSTSTFLTSAFVLPKNTNPAVGALGPNVTYTGNIGGVIKANISGGGNVNLNWFGTNPSELNLNGNPATGGGGVQVFDAKGAGSQILFDNASFQTEAFKPIAMVSNVRLENSQSEQISTNRQADFTDVKIGKHNSDYKVFAKKDGTNFVTAGSDDVLPAKCELVAQVFAQRRSILRHEAGRITLGTGEMLLNAHQTMQITTTLATVKVENGALAFVSSTENGTCIRVLSSAGTVSAFVDSQKISVSSGEELLVTRNKPSTSTSHFKDGVGRRNTNTSDCGSKYITTSDFSILSMLSNSDCFDARSERNKQLIARILKTAATVDVVFRTRGPYTAR
ncbi:MAG: hypothetical protein K2X29_13815, partial [Candidatus Obscuribacterales bacterium]|nr:hypothetical protein [Candidatus Obscuribacterales bacterium]